LSGSSRQKTLEQINLIPFAGPSNLFIAFTAALPVQSDPFTLGFRVALGATLAKGVYSKNGNLEFFGWIWES